MPGAIRIAESFTEYPGEILEFLFTQADEITLGLAQE
jgi:hypothetical protein